MKEYCLLLLFCFSFSPISGQQYQVFYPGGESTSGTSQSPPQNTFRPSLPPPQNNNFQPSRPIEQSPFTLHEAQEKFPRSGEVLGNFFNGNVAPSSPQPTSSSSINPFGSNHRFQPQPQQQPQQQQHFPITSNYLAPPGSTSLPRQTSFFGNNYDFFRQFHNSHLPQQQQQLQLQQQQQHQAYQPVRAASIGPFTTHSTARPTEASSPQTQSTESPFITSQFFTSGPDTDIPNNNNNNNNQDDYSFGPSRDQSSVSQASFQPSQTTFQVSPSSPPRVSSSPASFQQYQPSQESFQASPTSPPRVSSSPASFQSSPRSQTSYQTSPSPQTLYQTSPSPTAAYYTIPTHKTEISYPTNIQNNNAPVQNSLFDGYEEAAKALGLSHNLRVITTETLRAKPTISIETVPNSYSEVYRPFTEPPTPLRYTPIEFTFQYTPTHTTPQYVQTTTTPTTTTTTTTTTTPAPTTAPSTTPAPVSIPYRSPSRSTGRTIATAAVTPRQRQPLFRHANRVVNVNNDIDIETVDNEDLPIIVTTARPSTTYRTTHSPTFAPISTSRPVVYQQARRQPSSRPHVQEFQSNQGQLLGHPNEHQQQRPLTQGRQIGQQQNINDPHGPYYYNNLQPGSLYTNTNGAYQSYYNGQQQQQYSGPQQYNGQQQQYQQQGRTQQGLEELVPEVIEFNIPSHKMIPITETEEEDFGPFSRGNIYQSQHQSPSPLPIVDLTERTPVIVVTEATPIAPKKEETSEVYRVGPKGRLLKKRRRLRPQQPKQQQQQFQRPTTQQQATFAPSPTTPAVSYAVRNTLQPQHRPTTQQQYEQRPTTQQQATFAPPTTYRPRFNAVADEDENENEEVTEKVTTYRSKFRYSPSTSTTSSTSTQSSISIAQGATGAGGDEAAQKSKAIASRLKSLERQIRFKNRKNNPN